MKKEEKDKIPVYEAYWPEKEGKSIPDDVVYLVGPEKKTMNNGEVWYRAIYVNRKDGEGCMN